MESNKRYLFGESLLFLEEKFSMTPPSYGNVARPENLASTQGHLSSPHSAIFSTFLERIMRHATALLMGVYCVLAGKVASGGAGYLTAVTGSEFATPVGGEGVPIPTSPMSRTQDSGYHCHHLLHQN